MLNPNESNSSIGVVSQKSCVATGCGSANDYIRLLQNWPHGSATNFILKKKEQIFVLGEEMAI